MFFRHCNNCNQRWELGTASACKCPDWTPEEDEAFNDVEKHSNLGKQILRDMGQPYVYAPKREWVGLTDEEIEDFVSALWPVGAGAGKLLRAIEAKLKEKNHG
jgi:hypothetical protein